MQRLFFALSFMLFYVVSVAAPKIKQKANNSSWKTDTTWDLKRIPVSNDTVVIPAGNTVLIDDHQNLNSSKLIVMVYGILQFTSNGKLSLNANSAIFVQKGGIVDGNGHPSQQLRIGGQQLKGNELIVSATQEALLLTASSTGYDPVVDNSAFSSFAVLPVTFTSFSVAAKANGILVQWATAGEQNSSHFEVERSSDNHIWTHIGVVNAARNSTTALRYSFTDPSNNTGVFYYRIKQVDFDGRFIYTAIRTIKKNDPLDIRVTSAYNKLAVHFSREVKGAVEIRVMSMSGQIVSSQVLNQPAGQIVVDKKDQKGYHVVIVTNAKDVNVTQKVNF